MIALLLALTGVAPEQSRARADVLLQAPGAIGTPPATVAVQGATLYVASADRLAALDLADPARPVFLGQSPALGAQVAACQWAGP